MELLHPQPGWVEIDPQVLWEQFVDIITEVMEGILQIVITRGTNNAVNQSKIRAIRPIEGVHGIRP